MADAHEVLTESSRIVCRGEFERHTQCVLETPGDVRLYGDRLRIVTEHQLEFEPFPAFQCWMTAQQRAPLAEIDRMRPLLRPLAVVLVRAGYPRSGHQLDPLAAAPLGNDHPIHEGSVKIRGARADGNPEPDGDPKLVKDEIPGRTVDEAADGLRWQLITVREPADRTLNVDHTTFDRIWYVVQAQRYVLIDLEALHV